MKCEDCKFWLRWQGVKPETREYCNGNCHRYPPSDEGFPLVRDSSFCGEFKPKDVEHTD